MQIFFHIHNNTSKSPHKNQHFQHEMRFLAIKKRTTNNVATKGYDFLYCKTKSKTIGTIRSNAILKFVRIK